jgi:hypothetical protein
MKQDPMVSTCGTSEGDEKYMNILIRKCEEKTTGENNI